MQITVELPDDLAAHPRPERAALEALAIAGYRSGALSPFETRRLLSFETRDQLEGFLKFHQVWENAYDAQDFQDDVATLGMITPDDRRS